MELPFNVNDWRTIGLLVAAWMALSLVLALLLFVLVVRKMRRLNVPPGAGFGETLLYTPFLVVVFVDLLDWGLDVLAAPFTWVVLDRLGLRALRNVSTIEALIPFTQPIPTLTLSWIWVRIFGYHYPPFDREKGNVIEHQARGGKPQ